MTDRLSDLAADHLAIQQWAENMHRRPLEPEELEQIAEEVVEMRDEGHGAAPRVGAAS